MAAELALAPITGPWAPMARWRLWAQVLATAQVSGSGECLQPVRSGERQAGRQRRMNNPLTFPLAVFG